jgi:dolichol kinase
MLDIAACLIGAFSFMVISETLYNAKLLNAEGRRKFLHICTGSFVAIWPWLISWRAIQIIGLLMLIGTVINREHTFFRFTKDINRTTFGDYSFALAVLCSSVLTHNKVFFALAIFHLALADGLAAIIGKQFGKKYKYKVFGQTKSLIGTMTFWFVSLCILGIGIPFAHDIISYSNYIWLIALLPPLLAMMENLFVYGLDNVIIPVAVILALRLATI